ncbi:hypothetical protein [Candidatus Epulonipiscium viviparus]|uniref:hypothetical protein n=1 Tax=Candidatus Epulonipiscium viviparus TaxID=420336 RepID=UPI0027381342|nr:hypothetical protein [Candidatus Epulopiscium viviparus]
MKKFKYLFIAATMMVASSSAFAADLPATVLENSRCFELIDDVVASYTSAFASRNINPASYISKVNGEKNLQRVTFYYPATALAVDGSADIELPSDIASIMRFFGNFYYTGDFLNGNSMKLYLVEPNGKEHLLDNHNISWKGGGGKTVTYGKTAEVSKLPIGSPVAGTDYSGYKLRFKGNGTITQVYLWEQAGVPLEYDVSAYGVLGAELPIADVAINVDATTNISLDGHSEFDPSTYKRLHVNTGPIQLGSTNANLSSDDKIFSKAYQDWGFEPGRGAYHFKTLESSKLITEGDDGYSNVDALYAAYQEAPALQKKAADLFPSIGNDYVITFDGWPTWQWEPGAKMSTQSATPAYKHFDAAADTAAHLMRAFNNKFGDYAPKYLEVKNESTISGEWQFFNTHSDDVAWEYLAEFHNMVADAVHELNPETLVGGPSSAFMYLENDNFEEARYQLEFMDATKDTLDWYSHHFYENSDLMVNGRADNSDGFLAGRFEAVMDLLIGHMENTDNVKPFMITEAGSYNSLTTEIDNFQNLTAFNGYMMRFMQYPEVIDMYVPYLYPIASWAPTRDNNLYRYVNNNNPNQGIQDEMTYLEAYVDIWKDFAGSYVPADVVAVDELIEDRIFTTAARAGDIVYLAVHNLNPSQVEIDFDFGADIASASKKHCYLENAKLYYLEEAVEDLDNVHMRAQEMAIFEIQLAPATVFDGKLARESYYSVEELVPSGAAATFTVDVADAGSINSAVARVNFGREGKGFAGNLSVAINGVDVGTRSLDDTNKSGDLFTFMDFDIANPAIIRDGLNEVIISMPTGGVISNVKLTILN